MIRLAPALAALLCILSANRVSAASDGPRSPAILASVAELGTLAWAMPGNAAASDNARAAAATAVLLNTQALTATGFGFALPPAAQVTGIEVHVERSSPIMLTSDNAVRIVRGGMIGSADRALPGNWPSTGAEAVVTYGGPADLWGESWTAADINDSGFGAAVSARVSAVDTALIDHIAITVHYEVCGDGTLAAGEACDDGNTDDGDCCSSTCGFEPAGSACADGDLCNGGESCDGAGGCLDGAPLDCGDGNLCTLDSCEPLLGCVHDDTPRSDCRTALRSTFIHKKRIPESRDRLVWRWSKGEATTTPEYGIPSGTTAYALCVHAGGALALSAQVPPDGIAWVPVEGDGYKYHDASRTPDGIKQMSLRRGGPDQARIRLVGRGDNLEDGLAAPLALPVLVQLVNDVPGTCFEATFDSPLKNADGFFKAKQ